MEGAPNQTLELITIELKVSEFPLRAESLAGNGRQRVAVEVQRLKFPHTVEHLVNALDVVVRQVKVDQLIQA